MPRHPSSESATAGSPSPSQPQARASFVAFLRLESRTALGVRHLAMLVFLSLLGLLAFWLPRFPASVFRFFHRVFHLPDWAGIVFANELTGLFFFIYWIGVFDVLTIFVVPREERYLDVLLSKPLSRRAYMLAKLLPLMARATGIGLIAAAFHWAGLAAAGLPYDPRAFFGASIATIAWAVLLVALVNVLVLGARDSYTALLVAFVPIIVSMLPGMIYIYRPDAFEGMPLLRDLAVFPLNLVWHKGLAARWGVVLAGLLLAAAACLAALAGRRIERREVA